MLLQDVTPVRNVNYAFWSIAVEWHIYLMFPVMLLIWRRWNVCAGVAAGAAIGALGVAALRLYPALDGIKFAYYFLFAISVGACALGAGSPPWARRLPWTAAGLGSFALVVVAVASHPYDWYVAHYNPLDVSLGCSLCCLLIGMEMHQGRLLARALQWQPLAKLGFFSYSIYLVHAPVLEGIWRYGARPLHLGGTRALTFMLGLAAPVAITVSYGFYRFAEKPFLTQRVDPGSQGAGQRRLLAPDEAAQLPDMPETSAKRPRSTSAAVPRGPG